MTKSRNQREGKFIAGWCLNPNYRQGRDNVYRAGIRAGAYADLKRMHNLSDGYAVLPGVSYVRTPRQGV